MREGRRQRLGLQDGTDGTVQDTYLDRILEEEGPRTLDLGDDAFVDTRDNRYVQDAYNYYLGGGKGGGINTATVAPDFTGGQMIDTGGGGGQNIATGGVDTTPTDNLGFDADVTPGPSGFIGLDPDMDVDPFEYTDYGTDDPQVPVQDPTTMIPQLGSQQEQGFDLDSIGQSIANFAGTAYNKFNQSVTLPIVGKVNLASTAAKSIINKLAGGPISLVVDALSALGLEPGPTLQTEKADSIGLLNENDTAGYQDIYGINTQSQFGDYDQYNIDRVEQLEAKVNKTPRDEAELQQRKEYNKISGVGGDIDYDPTGDAQIAEQIEADNRAAEQKARQETDARMAAQAASRAAAAAAAAAADRRSGGGGRDTGGARGGGTSATSSGLGGLGFSDIRLKDNVELIGKSPSNINIYKFNYKGDSTVYEGVIANELPWASVEASNGYLMVDYNKIDVELKKHDKN